MKNRQSAGRAKCRPVDFEVDWEIMETNGHYYLGRIFDAGRGETTGQPLLYDPADLTTHAIIVGMTGSGKTGLCLNLMEEAALAGVPALMIDPKGDITNALLHFPELAPADFLPWIDAGQARRAGKTVEQAATETAARWRQGLAEWDIAPERLRALQEAVHFTVYTPGSQAGVPVSILASLKAPAIPWENDRELPREKVSSTVTALLGLLGFKNVDPIRSREHILLANIFERAWSQGQDLDLAELIMQVQTPPFDRLGIFEVNTFFPDKERFALAMTLNNILAAPTFQSWIEGQPLDVQGLLYTAGGQPRHSIFTIAHLNDDERMFFVTLLFSAVETWMRGQGGSPSLRALVYFDEIFGYLPPISNPPAKPTLLRLLKQARAFGVGLVLATQNPADVDYKALANAGTWFIGKLQTDQDKQRLLDGLTGAAVELDRGQYDALLSSLGRRVFLLHNVHAARPLLFQTRWAMNYLAGPLTRAQIPALNALAGAAPPAAPPVQPAASQPVPVARPQQPVEATSSTTRPAAPAGVVEYFLPVNVLLPAGTPAGELFYRPVLLAQARVRFLNRKYNLDHETQQTVIVPEPDRRGVVQWGDFTTLPLDSRTLPDQPAAVARFAPLVEPLTDARLVKALAADFQDWVYRTAEAWVKANEALQVYAGPDVPEESFRQLCALAAAGRQEAEAAKVAAAFAQKREGLEQKMVREQRELAGDEVELAQRKREETVTHAETILSLFGRRRRSLSTSMTKRRMTEKARSDVEESEEALAGLEGELAALDEEEAQALAGVAARWANTATQTSEIPVRPYKKDVTVEMFGVAWLPYYLVEAAGPVREIPGFEPGQNAPIP
ncbi:MAG: type IV secretion system DNA-binding domain-containing protein [Chloroflexi bacterium]|nr:type IV secretion system DNA-binding domain-containing protein [Chloroflexota bacterium]MCI0577731.1 type IV secretion system DNA-binding domain-containing protein [Chloroflexota bacterium]MCI0644007.1 type IV secretion system DNA-binding domain-containing protein [Chloroflexota bacterium]MCI0731994.1 type IV secretion system DNA-binding domain-containing protein [Chloroflexota bacterium]